MKPFEPGGPRAPAGPSPLPESQREPHAASQDPQQREPHAVATPPQHVPPPPRPARENAVVSVVVPVYTFDIDLAGIVSNIVYLRWSEIWRLALLERMGFAVEQVMRGGILPIVARHELNYRRSMRLGESVRLEGWIERIGGSSATLWLEMRDAASGALSCENRQVVVMVDTRTGGTVDIPTDYRSAMEQLMA